MFVILGCSELLECASDSCGKGSTKHLTGVPVLGSGFDQEAKVGGSIFLSSLAVLLSKCVVDLNFTP